LAKTVVIGAGLAGQAAAKSAASRGAGVTLIERSASLPLRKDAWPQLISNEVKLDRLEKDAELRLTQLARTELRFSESVEGVDISKRLVRTLRGTVPFDSLIISSGSSPVKMSLPGSSKRNVFAMSTLESFVRLGERVAEFSTLAVSGASPLALGVTETLVELGKKVILFAPGGLLCSALDHSMRALLEKRIARAGVRLVETGADSVAGVVRVEAILSAGSVYPCEALILFPGSSPNPVNADLRRGTAGGFVVDSEMRTSNKRVFAAGDCAEVRIGPTSLPLMYSSSAEVMGEVAGINSAGGSARANLSGAGLLGLFGLEICHAGVTLSEANRLGLDALAAVGTYPEDAERKCSIVFLRGGRVILGVQIIDSKAGLFAGEASLAVSRGLSLEELAYQDAPHTAGVSSDISPLARAARVGLSMVTK
jgi:pyruvate/2-oxoglutarate dehydrogenase complex dihydrolipoamide dehydrogenase (E3) component